MFTITHMFFEQRYILSNKVDLLIGSYIYISIRLKFQSKETQAYGIVDQCSATSPQFRLLEVFIYMKFNGSPTRLSMAIGSLFLY